MSLRQVTALVSSASDVAPLVMLTPLDASPAFGASDPTDGSPEEPAGVLTAAALFDGNPLGPLWSLQGWTRRSNRSS